MYIQEWVDDKVEGAETVAFEALHEYCCCCCCFNIDGFALEFRAWDSNLTY